VKVIGHAPKIKMMKEHGRHLRLDDEAERKLTMGGLACNWRPRTRDLFRDIVILMRDTGMRNERELFRMRIENLDWSPIDISPLASRSAAYCDAKLIFTLELFQSLAFGLGEASAVVTGGVVSRVVVVVTRVEASAAVFVASTLPTKSRAML
jgi:hypothetical protein